MKPDESQRKLPEEQITSSSSQQQPKTNAPETTTTTSSTRTQEALKQLFCGGVAGSVAKTVTAPFSRLTILFQVHSLVTTKEHRPKFAMSLRGGVSKILQRGGLLSMWKGNMTSVLHRFPYSAINFYIYENTMDVLSGMTRQQIEEPNETEGQLMRRMSKIVFDEDEDNNNNNNAARIKRNNKDNNNKRSSHDDTPASHKFLAGATAGTIACLACYPLDLVRTRLTTELEGKEHYRGIVDAFRKIYGLEGLSGFYSGVGPTLLVAIPNFAISYTVYGTLKEYMLDDELFYNLRRINADSGEPRLGFGLTVMCGAASGTLATLITFPMDTIRRRMQIQNLHLAPELRLSSSQQFQSLVMKEGLGSLYRGLTPELLKVIPMVGTMFVVYEKTKEMLNVTHDRR